MEVLRAWRCHLRAGFQQCKSFVEMCPVRCCPLWHPAHCPPMPRPRLQQAATARQEKFQLPIAEFEHHDRCFSTLVLVYFAQRMGSV